jgi:hypothetical protein
VYAWPTDLVPRLAEGLDEATLTYLDALAVHPALAEWALLGRAGGLDELDARYSFPLPDTVAMWNLPIPRLSWLREAAYAQVGAAVAAAARGRTAEAETRLREIIGAGLLIGEEGATLITNLVGFVVADVGAESLVRLYDATGRPAEAVTVRNLQRAGERAAGVSRTGLGQTEMFEMPSIVTDTLTIRGMRWEFFTILNTLGPCLNLNRVVFGPPVDHEAWIEEVRMSLVRTEGERELFDLARRGWGVGNPEGVQPVVRLFAQMMGGGVESCASLAAAAG